MASGTAIPAPAPLAASGASAPVLVGNNSLVATLVTVSTAVLSTSVIEVTTTRI